MPRDGTLTFNSSTEPKHSVIGETMNATNIMARVIGTECLSWSSVC